MRSDGRSRLRSRRRAEFRSVLESVGHSTRVVVKAAMDADPEVVLDLDEQVGQPDQATAGVQPERPGEQRVGPQGRCARLPRRNPRPRLRCSSRGRPIALDRAARPGPRHLRAWTDAAGSTPRGESPCRPVRDWLSPCGQESRPPGTLFPARQALGVVAGSSESRGGEVIWLHGDGFGVAPALPGASCSAFDRRRMFDVFGNGGVQPPHSLHKRALAGNNSARRAPHLAHHAAAVGRTCGPPARPDSEGVMFCSTAVRRLFEPDERLTRRPAGPRTRSWGRFDSADDVPRTCAGRAR